MESLLWILRRLKDYYLFILLALLGMLLESISTSGISLLVKSLVDNGMLLKDWNSLLLTTSLLLAFAITQQLGNFLVSYYTNLYAEKEAKNIREQIFSKFLNSSFLSVKEYSIGEYTTRILSDLRIYRDLVGSSVVKLVRDPTTAILLFGVLLYRDWQLTIFLLLLVPFLSLSVGYFGKKRGKHLKKAQESQEKLITKVGDVFRGFESIKTFPAKDLLFEWFKTINQKTYRASTKATFYASLNSVFNYSTGYLVIALLLFYGGLRVLEGALTLGEFISYLTALVFIQKPIVESQKGIVEVKANLPVVGRIMELLKLEEERKGESVFLDLREGIKVDRLSVKLDGKTLLREVSFSIRKGEKVAIMGSTGSGKSTVLRVLCGFIPYEGNIFYDDRELRELDLFSLRSKIAYLTQESFILSGTVRENLLISKPEAKEEELWKALQLSMCDFVKSLDEEVDKENRLLSGGEAQRLALARIFLKEPEILLLDEATSALDANTENVVLKNLFDSFPESTFIIVAHRFSNILACDRAILFKNGQIVFDGNPKEAVEIFLSEYF
ncbi:ABC transporter ATP-binding protein [Thermocrinis sp.]|uniref:ABC transporter ATP-binding protein n=1 Tax=Thermocrinis sp. TaxID=2024383 RepID=UPI002FDE2EE3